MEKQWFVLHTMTGKERKVRDMIVSRVQLERMEEYVGRCEVPTDVVKEKKDGKTRKSTRLIFPGCVFVQLALYDDAKGYDDNGRRSFYDRTWQFVRETPGVLGFLCCDRLHPQPQPLKQSEIDAVLSDKKSAATPAERPRVAFSVDETVKITDGAFMGLTGQVSMVDPDKGKLKVDVQVFGRKVPVDVENWQVEKVAVEETFESAQ